MTIKDIARLSGCGVATVSRVLNHHPDVSESTRQRVLAVVEQYGFQPNNNAKHLKQQAGTSIAILVKGTENMLFADLVEKIQALLRESGRDAAVYYLDEDANEVSYACQLCRERKPLGILFLGGDLEFFRNSFGQISIPCVLLTNSAQELGYDNLSSLTTDDEAAAGQVVEYLAGQGHRHIGVLGGSWSCSQSQISCRRIQGCRAALGRLGLPFDEGQCEPCRYSMAEGYAAALRLLMLQTHYRSPLDFSWERLEGAENSLERIATCMENLMWAANHASGEADADRASALIAAAERAAAEFEASMDDDFNTAGAVAAYFQLVTEANTYLDEVGGAADAEACTACAAGIAGAFSVLGVELREPKEELPVGLLGVAAGLVAYTGDDVDEAAERILAARAEARAAKNWELADAIRDQLRDMGLVIEDTAAGSRLKRA